MTVNEHPIPDKLERECHRRGDHLASDDDYQLRSSDSQLLRLAAGQMLSVYRYWN
jgi:hypothetical protein